MYGKTTHEPQNSIKSSAQIFGLRLTPLIFTARIKFCKNILLTPPHMRKVTHLFYCFLIRTVCSICLNS